MRESPGLAGSGSAPPVTIIIPVYNGADTIGACVSSLLAQRYPRERFEIVVVDNGSSDTTREELRAFGNEIRVLTEATRGAAAARNRGVREAQGGLIAFIDADCTADPDWLSALVSPLGDPAVGVVGGRILSRVEGNRIERFGECIHDHQRAIEEEDRPYVISMNWGSRRDVLQAAGLFDESLLRGQDVDLAWRIHRSGARLVYAPTAIVRHRNERSIWGLMHEGYVHGRHSVRVMDKHATAESGRSRSSIRARLLGDLSRLARGPGRSDGLLWLLFDAGKSAGEFVGLAHRRERQ